MLATPQQQRYEARPRIPNLRTAKNATRQRRVRAARARNAVMSRFCIGLVGVLTLVMVYVMLMAHLTSMNYSLAKAERERTALQAQTMRLDDRLARLRSDDRLAAIAAKLGMHDPQQFALVKLPPPAAQRDRSHLALFTSVAGWLSAGAR